MKWNGKRPSSDGPAYDDDFTVQYEDDFGPPRDGEVYQEPYEEDVPRVYHEPAYRNEQAYYNDGYASDYGDQVDGYDRYSDDYDNYDAYGDYEEPYQEPEKMDYLEIPEKKQKKKRRKNQPEYEQPPKKKKKRGCFLHMVFRLLALALVVVIGFFGFLLIRLDPADFPTSDAALGVNSSISENSVVNIALFGVDARDYSTNSRSDAIMILSVDMKHGKIKLSTLMRDTLVQVSGYDGMKLTECYAYGGPELAVRAINENFGMDIKEYATVTFKAMADIIDAAGGVEINITEEERVSANGSVWEQWDACGMEEDYIREAGEQTLSGTQAVAYARIRHVGNADYQRTSRQRRVLTALVGQLLTHPQNIPKTLMTAEDVVDTSLNQADILSLTPIVLRGMKVESARFPLNADIISDSYYVGNAACIYADMDATKGALHDFIYNDIDPTTDADRRSNGEPG